MRSAWVMLFAILLLAGCSQTDRQRRLEAKVDSLQQQLNDSYVPGFGEFMSAIQVHHAKLWFAGTNNNWKLADFEVHEIMESLDDLEKYEKARPETKMLTMLAPAIDSVNQSITKESLPDFKRSFILLTNTCNNCHRAVHYEFNNVQVPSTPPFSNQIFKKQ